MVWNPARRQPESLRSTPAGTSQTPSHSWPRDASSCHRPSFLPTNAHMPIPSTTSPTALTQSSGIFSMPKPSLPQHCKHALEHPSSSQGSSQISLPWHTGPGRTLPRDPLPATPVAFIHLSQGETWGLGNAGTHLLCLHNRTWPLCVCG